MYGVKQITSDCVHVREGERKHRLLPVSIQEVAGGREESILVVSEYGFECPLDA